MLTTLPLVVDTGCFSRIDLSCVQAGEYGLVSHKLSAIGSVVYSSEKLYETSALSLYVALL